MDAHDRMFGEIAVRLELLTREQLASCRRVQAEGGPSRNLGQLALALGLLSEAEVELVFSHQKRVLTRRREAREPTKRTETSAAITSAQRPSRATRSSSPAQPAAAASRSRKVVEDEREPTVPRVPPEPRSLLGIGLGVPDLPPNAHDLALASAASQPVLQATGSAVNGGRARSFAAGGTGSARNVASVVSPDTGSLRALEPGTNGGRGGSFAGASSRASGGGTQASRASVPAARMRGGAPSGAPSGPPPRPAASPPPPPRAAGTRSSQVVASSSSPARASTASGAPPARAASGHPGPPTRGDGSGPPSQREARASATPVQRKAHASSAPPDREAPEGGLPSQLESRPGSGPPAHASSERPPRKLEAPPFRAKRLVGPPPANENGLPEPARAADETPLGTSVPLEHLSRDEALRAFGPRPGSPRPVLDRGWRNPSKPPPPQAAQGAEPLPANLLQAAPSTGRFDELDAAAAASLDAGPRFEKYLDQLLQIAADSGASDLHAHSGAPVLARVDGALHALTGEAPLSPEAAEAVIAEVLDDRQWDTLQARGEVRFGYELAGVGRFRAHAYRQERGVDVVFRVLMPAQAPAQLELDPRLLETLLGVQSGLIVVSGPPGSGKTTTLAALAHALANEHQRYVVTAEAPIEIAHRTGLGMIEQREIPFDAHSFAECIEQAARQAADAIVISELSSPSSVAAAVQAALSGTIVVAAVQADNPWRALAQLSSHFHGDERRPACIQLASALRAVFGQRLVARATGRGRLPVLEILRASASVAQLIVADEFDVLERVIAGERASDMCTLEDALNERVRTGAITLATAHEVARRKELLAGGADS